MPRKVAIIFACILMIPTKCTTSQRLGKDLPPLIKQGLDDLITGKYLNALLDFLLFESTHSWTPDLYRRIMAYLSSKDAVITLGSLQTSWKNHLRDLLDQPKMLLSESLQINFQQFHLAMKYLLNGKRVQFGRLDVVLDFEILREKILQSPGGTRTLFLVTLQNCLPALNMAECVETFSQVLRMSSGRHLQPEVVKKLPGDLQEEPFKNLSSVFKELYDKIPASTQRALYEWMTLILQKSFNSSKSNISTSWVSAESLWIMGRYMVHLPLEAIQNIDLNDIRLFISYDNATKQLDTVYDITPMHAEAFLERIDSSGFDMRNITTLYRLGLLVCFYDIFQNMDASLAQVLLHQMKKCNQLRGFHAEVQKVKSLLLDIAMMNQTLNETLGALSDAVVQLTSRQLESLSSEAVQTAIVTLQQVSGWTKSQIMILAGKYLNSGKAFSLQNITQMGELVSGIGTQSFYNMSPRELSIVIKGGLSQYAADLSPAKQEAIMSKLLELGNTSSALTDIQGVFFQHVPLSVIFRHGLLEPSTLKDKELRRSQAMFLYESLSKKTSSTDLLSTGQLINGVTCEHIEDMEISTFLNHFRIFENNLDMLSPYQMNCLAWKFWKVANTSVPPYLLAVLPTEYLKSVSPLPCVPFLISLQKIELDTLVFNVKKKKAIVERVQECLNGSIDDEYDVDLLGKMICHLSPAIIQSSRSLRAMVTAIEELKNCKNLSLRQKTAIYTRLKEIYGNPKDWAAETILDVGCFLTLLSREEFSILAKKFPNPVLQIASKVSGAALTEEVISAIFDAVSDSSASANVSDPRVECLEVRVPSSGDIMKLGEANSCWSVQELQCMDMDTFTKNVEVLGSVQRFSTSQLTVLKEKAQQVWGEPGNWRSYHIVSLGRIATALNESEIKELDLSSVDTVIALSQQTRWTSDQAHAIFQGYLKDSDKSVSQLKSYELVALGGNLCAVDPKEVSSIKTSEFSAVVARVGALPCSLPVRHEFKKKAEAVFGKSAEWNSSILYDIGTIAAGLSKDDIKYLNKDMMPFFHPSAIEAMPVEILRELSPEQIANLGPENAAVVTEQQRLHLSHTQRQSLEQALDGARIRVQESHITTPRTTIPTEAPTPNCAVYWRSSCDCFCILFIIFILQMENGLPNAWP